MPVQAALAAVAIGTGIATTLASIKDMKLRADIERNLGYLTLKQKNDLDKELVRTQDVNKRIEILTNAIATIRGSQTSSILSSTIITQQKAKSRSQTIMAISIVGGAIVLFGAIYFLKNK
jgi:hypothetical protein